MSKRTNKQNLPQLDKLPESSVFVTPQVVAKALDYTARSIKRFMAAGKLPGRKFGSEWRMHIEDFRKITTPQLPDKPLDNSQHESAT